ncbi:unnamed protein product [Symbiodinium natans]|uniref:Uncharacterized protein n=1 Tax=Symbiodinium natans TaxID=878477 RepID=A0A812JDE1_9DINO|nr:unnamed protein product [Symbiodinium natans]
MKGENRSPRTQEESRETRGDEERPTPPSFERGGRQRVQVPSRGQLQSHLEGDKRETSRDEESPFRGHMKRDNRRQKQPSKQSIGLGWNSEKETRTPAEKQLGKAYAWVMQFLEQKA